MTICRAYAKVNLTLEVLGRRVDGYHDLVSIVQAIDLHDTLRVVAADHLALVCNDNSIAVEDNLAWQAARLLSGRAKAHLGASIVLEKRIPVAAGLGGGSSDAAATLLALRHLWRMDTPESELALMAAALGSDVPYFLHGGTALIAGRGDSVVPLPSAPARWLLLLRPPVSLPAKTATLYGRLSPNDYDDGLATHAAAERVACREFPAENLLRNTFEKIAFKVFPGLAEARDALGAAAGRPVHLSGAGPTLFSIFAEQQAAETALSALVADGREAYVASTGPYRAEPVNGV